MIPGTDDTIGHSTRGEIKEGCSDRAEEREGTGWIGKLEYRVRYARTGKVMNPEWERR